MCNIAGYAGSKQAAPILLEMLRRQEAFDGDMSTGIATIHEGKLHYRKITGTVDEMIAKTDVLELPGTIGIAHTRPSVSTDGIPYHPFLNPEKTLALVTNGTTPATRYAPQWTEAARKLVAAGYDFVHKNPQKDGQKKHPYLDDTGEFLYTAELRALLVDLYMKQGMSIPQAAAKTCGEMVSDNATVFITEKDPDSIFALRTTRGLVAAMSEGETYMATTRFGLPEHLAEDAMDLPLFHCCKLTREGVTVMPDKMEAEPVSQMTPYTYLEAYTRFEAFLTSEKAPAYFDQLEFFTDELRNIWPGDHTYVQHARLVYDMLWQFEKEGRLRKELRPQKLSTGASRRRWYFWLENE